MPQLTQSPGRSVFGSLALIAVIVGLGAAAFAYTAGWFSPARISPAKWWKLSRRRAASHRSAIAATTLRDLLYRRLRSEWRRRNFRAAEVFKTG